MDEIHEANGLGCINGYGPMILFYKCQVLGENTSHYAFFKSLSDHIGFEPNPATHMSSTTNWAIVLMNN